MTLTDMFTTYLLKSLTSRNSTHTRRAPRTLHAKTRTVQNTSEWLDALTFVKCGRSYIFEIVRPWEDHHKYDYVRTTNINCNLRIVCRYKMFVRKVRSTSSEIRIECTGYDRVGNCVSGTYVFYDVPDLVEHRDNFILSITECVYGQ